MPCYVITHTRFRGIAEFHRFRARLEALADGRHLRLLPLHDCPPGADDQAVMMEFDTAESATAFMCSAGYRAIATPEPHQGA
ncbi:hypothetical protein [Pseudooceanicola sp.]|uniref:hypothetical protein n=1 Tax=Pseudooceanicola sp. TaxID=1914328 RepID=UPI0040597D06